MQQEKMSIDKNMSCNAHSFHIPVMGTSFTIDTPMRVARYGISSVISLVDDTLIEQMRKYYCEKEGRDYKEILQNDEDSRARRITEYLDLVNEIVLQQVGSLKSPSSSFEKGSELSRYYKMLPDSSLKSLYYEMLETQDCVKKAKMQKTLRENIIPGKIDVNIMTKLDRNQYLKGQVLPAEYSDALSALRGYAKSSLDSSIVFSAGINPRLFAYISSFDDFFPDKDGFIKKRIILKVSDYRSALIQGKYLVKRGLWVSEYRIESGFNCGGHTFVSDGKLLGPILEEFKEKKEELLANLLSTYVQALKKREKHPVAQTPDIRITVQGGITTAAENELLLHYYNVDGTGWGTPFLLVPEVSTVDEKNLQKLMDAGKDDVFLSNSSPLGVPFWNLKKSASEEARRERIQQGNPGSHCPKKFAISNTEFTKTPICLASRAYQRRKLEQLSQKELSQEQLAASKKEILDKSCICHDLSGAAVLKYDIEEKASPAICCGPSISYFSKIATLDEMVDHIYGRISLLNEKCYPHMFIKEIEICMSFLKKEFNRYSLGLSPQTPKYFENFKENLLKGVEYYLQRADDFFEKQQESFLADLGKFKKELNSVYS